MKKLILGLFLLFGAQVFAQGRMSEDVLKKMQEEEIAALALNEEQIPDYKEINKNFMEGLKDLRNSGDNRSKRFEQMRKLSEKRDEDLKELLTEDQFKKYTKMQEERREQMRGRMRDRRQN
tara:strand:+ start:635 stop:997 length:363 start_codon:yes stop_codon:yes gene_type:complete